MDFPAYYRGNVTYIEHDDVRLDAIVDIVGELAPPATLDLGCGTGWLARRLLDRVGGTVVGLDILTDVRAAGWGYVAADLTAPLPVPGRLLLLRGGGRGHRARARPGRRAPGDPPPARRRRHAPDLHAEHGVVGQPDPRAARHPAARHRDQQRGGARPAVARCSGRGTRCKDISRSSPIGLSPRSSSGTGSWSRPGSGCRAEFPFPVSLVDRFFMRFVPLASDLLYVARRVEAAGAGPARSRTTRVGAGGHGVGDPSDGVPRGDVHQLRLRATAR